MWWTVLYKLAACLLAKSENSVVSYPMKCVESLSEESDGAASVDGGYTACGLRGH